MKQLFRAGVVFALAGILRLLPWTLCSVILSNVCYASLIFIWGYSLRRRITRRDIRDFLLVGCALMLLWLFLRAGKYELFPENDLLRRHLWYFYYIPIIFAPLLGFLAALRLGPQSARQTDRPWNALFLPAAFLTAVILTNDLHQLAFRFQSQFVNWDFDYAHGPLYYLVMAWSIGLMMASVALIFWRCRVADSRRLVWMPVALFFAGFAATLAAFRDWYELFQVPELMCLTFAMTWESCIRIGLLPSNRDYEACFMHSGVAARITDRQGQTRYRSHPPASAEQTRPEDLRLNQADISGGRIEWEDNLEQLHRLNDQLKDMQERLSEQALLTSAENEMKEKRARLEEKNLLYDCIRQFARPCLELISRDLDTLRADDPAFRRKIAEICLRGAYVKRRSNLMLLAEKNSALSSDELLYCLRESLEYLSMEDASASLTHEGSGHFPAETLILAYDFFQAALEALLPPPVMLMAHLHCEEERFSLRLVTERPCLRPAASAAEDAWAERLVALGGCVDCVREDDVCYTTLRIGKERK